jgi:hypothetical protein
MRPIMPSGGLDLSANLCVAVLGGKMKVEFIVYGLLGWAVFLLIVVLWLEVLARMDDKRFKKNRPAELDNDPY